MLMVCQLTGRINKRGTKMKKQISFKSLDLADLGKTFLETFNRYQVTNRVWYKENSEFMIKSDHFIDEWDDKKKRFVIEDLKQCLNKGGAVIAAYDDEGLTGFANVEAKLFGSNKEYVELPYIHVSYEKRGFGIGKELLSRCSMEARKLGAKKLYIAAHPSVESQAFYQAMGCESAAEINQYIVEKEPLDLQLEKKL
jgi:GNAT superfamily N-acetyltransferase